MKLLVLVMISLCTILESKAHSPALSNMVLVQAENNQWTLQVRSSIDAFRKEVKMHYRDTPYETPEEFKEQVLAHLQKTIIISANGMEDLVLDNGFVKLGHETVVVYNNLILPSDISKINITGKMFQDIYQSKVGLVILMDGVEKNPITLSKKNKYLITLELEGNKFVDYSVTKEGLVLSSFSGSKYLVFSLGLLALFGVARYYR